MNDNTNAAANRLYRIRHSLAHVMAQAVLEMREGSTLGFGPPIDDGFYYDFILTAPITEADLPDLERRMRRILKKGQRFHQEELPVADAFARLEEMREPYKREYAAELVAKGDLAQLSFFRNGPFLDMCEGPHVDTTRDIPRDAFKLRSVAGAYWRGDSNNVMMTRIYAWAFATKAELDAAVRAHQLALERDHKKLGRELDLFAFDDDVAAAWPAALAAERHGDPRRAGKAGRGTGVSGRLPARGHAPHRQKAAFTIKPATWRTIATACTRRWRWSRRRPAARRCGNATC